MRAAAMISSPSTHVAARTLHLALGPRTIVHLALMSRKRLEPHHRLLGRARANLVHMVPHPIAAAVVARRANLVEQALRRTAWETLPASPRSAPCAGPACAAREAEASAAPRTTTGPRPTDLTRSTCGSSVCSRRNASTTPPSNTSLQLVPQQHPRRQSVHPVVAPWLLAKPADSNEERPATSPMVRQFGCHEWDILSCPQTGPRLSNPEHLLLAIYSISADSTWLPNRSEPTQQDSTALTAKSPCC